MCRLHRAVGVRIRARRSRTRHRSSCSADRLAHGRRPPAGLHRFLTVACSFLLPGPPDTVISRRPPGRWSRLPSVRRPSVARRFTRLPTAGLAATHPALATVMYGRLDDCFPPFWPFGNGRRHRFLRFQTVSCPCLRFMRSVTAVSNGGLLDEGQLPGAHPRWLVVWTASDSIH